MEILIYYLLIINAAAFLLMLADKHKARKNRWRIPEATLMGIAVLGGSLGAIFGMQLLRHKTRKPKFFIGLPVILAAQVLIVILIIKAA